jgi:hypothetical protein
MNMAHRTNCTSLHSFGALQAAWNVLAIAALVLAPQSGCAQLAKPAAPDDNVGLYRAFYYKLDASNKPQLAHIENVRDLSGRIINTLPVGFNAPPAPDAQHAPKETTAVIDGEVVFAVYYGVEFWKPRPRIGRPKPGEGNVVATPQAVEWLSDRDIGRAIQCADTNPQDTCLFPKMCHCGAIGSCCCY